MNIVDYFDVGNYEHLKAWETMLETGMWPKNFWKKIDGMDFPAFWHTHITVKMANEYLKTTLNAMEGK